MNWGTITEGMRVDMGRPVTDLDKIRRCVVLAIRQHADQHFWFNELSFSFQTSIGSGSYDTATVGFPAGLVSILGENLFVDINGLSSNRCALYRRAHEFIESCRSSVSYTSQPELFSYFANKLELYPTPDASNHVIRGRAVVDQWTPIVRYESPDWKFYKPQTTIFDPGNLIADSYPDASVDEVNPWLTEVDDMIALYAQYLFWSQMAQATDGQDQRALAAYVAALASVQEKTSALAMPFEIEPYPIGLG